MNASATSVRLQISRPLEYGLSQGRPLKSHFYLWQLLVAIALTGAVSGGVMASPEEDFAKVKPLLDKYCNTCHSAEKNEGGLNLERFGTHEHANAEKKIWDTVQGRFIAQEMPPAGSKVPNAEEKKILNAWLNVMVKHEGDCTEIASDRNTNFYRGHVMSRRLTRMEYTYAMRDLLGVEVLATESLPSDGSGGEGFDAVGDSLFLSPIHLEKYLETAEQVTLQLWPDQTPAQESELVAQRRREIGGDTVGAGENGRDVAAQTLGKLIRFAFRRPVSAEELDRYLAFYESTVQRGESHRAGLRMALQGILISPHFLFLAEPEPEEDGIYPLLDHPLAARLAMFLWSSLPDEELMAAADAGLLQQDDELRKQVRRMLKDPRSKTLGENFAMQWLGLSPLGVTIRPDPEKFPEFTDELATAMQAETAFFVASLFSEDRSLLELLDADYTFLNERLAVHYGVSGVAGNEFRRVALTDRNRGGVLTQASVLTVSSYPLRTSPVLRGRWLLEEILGSRVPPPPPGVPPFPEQDPNAPKLTQREQLEIHRANPACASCHDRMDPLGFGMENFDPIGRWRANIDGLDIDASGKLPSGEKFSGPVELKVILLKRKNDVMKHLARKMYGYAIGRNLNKFDDCVIQNAVAALKENDYRASILPEQIVLSYQFRHRYCKK